MIEVLGHASGNEHPWNEAFLGQPIESSADESFPWTPTSNACSKQAAVITPMLHEAHINERVSLGFTTPSRLAQPLAFTHSTITHTLASSDIEQHILYQIYCSLTVCWQRCCHSFKKSLRLIQSQNHSKICYRQYLRNQSAFDPAHSSTITSAAVPL